MHAILTGILCFRQDVEREAYLDYNDYESAIFQMFAPIIYKTANNITINESEFVGLFRQEFIDRGIRTAVLNGEPNVVVVYYGDNQNETVQKLITDNRMRVKYTSYLSPKQASMII